jgi:GNAT superfamily N-acetyltransferase
VRIRPLDKDRDLAAVLSLVGRSRARADPGAIFHPGGLQWWLRRIGLDGFNVPVLVNHGEIVGFALRDGRDVIVQADTEHAANRADLLAWVESRARAAHAAELLLSVAERDQGLRSAALARGYEPTDNYGYELVGELDGAHPDPEIPTGFEIVTLTPALADPYVEMHRAAWSRPNTPSTYDRRQHDLVTAMPDFRYDLVPIVVSPAGAFASYCMSWWDPRSASVEIEPLGTPPDFRRMGLARAIVREVLRRSRALGARYVLVWGTTANPEAEALYLSAGLRVRSVLREHRLALE